MTDRSLISVVVQFFFFMVSYSFLVIEDRSYAKFCPHIEFSIFFVLSKNREVTGQLPKLFTAGAFTR